MALAGAVSLLVAGCSSTPELTFVHMTDSQFGFYDYEKEYDRYKTAISLINADAAGDKPKLMVMTGDMVNIASADTNADFIAATAALNIPSYVLPGNHDINIYAGDAEAELTRYFGSFGKDYYTHDEGDYRFIMVNTNLWKYPQARTASHDKWFAEALRMAKDEGKIIIVAGHSPIFLENVDEPEDRYYNIEPEKRKWVLEQLKQNDVILYIGGHCHRLLEREWEGIKFRHSETTSTNFDNRPYGYRMVKIVGKDVVDYRFMPLEKGE